MGRRSHGTDRGMAAERAAKIERANGVPVTGAVHGHERAGTVRRTISAARRFGQAGSRIVIFQTEGAVGAEIAELRWSRCLPRQRRMTSKITAVRIDFTFSRSAEYFR